MRVVAHHAIREVTAANQTGAVREYLIKNFVLPVGAMREVRRMKPEMKNVAMARRAVKSAAAHPHYRARRNERPAW